MRKTILIIAALCIGITNAHAQEFMINDIAKGTMPNIANGGDMGQFTYTYHTTSDDTLHVTLLDPRLMVMSKIGISVKGMGTVMSTSFNGQQLALILYNADKKVATVLSTDQEAKNVVKKSIKGISSVSDKAYVMPSINPEKLIVVHESNNGSGYTCLILDSKLEELKKITGNKQIVDVTMNMDVVRVITKTAANGVISFGITNIQSESGEIMSELDLKDGDDGFYPNFFSTSEGMSYTGGIYFTKGKYSDKSPEGIYFSMLTPENTFAEMMKIPYSVVIQDIKRGYAGKLTSGEYKLMLHSGARRMDGSGFVISGEIYSLKRTANGEAIFKVYDMVSIKFDNELKYKGTIVTNKTAKEATVKGSILKSNDVDVALWMKKMNFFDFKKYLDMGAKPNIVYTDIDDQQALLAAKVPGDTTKAIPVSFVMDKLGMGGNKTPMMFNSDAKTLYQYGVLTSPEPNMIILYNYKHPSLLIWSSPMPTNEGGPDENDDDDNGIDNNHPGDEPRDDNVIEPEEE